MNTVTFYRWSLLMPIALPVALLTFVGGTGVLAVVAQFFYWSLLFGGIPYVLTLALYSRPLMRGNEREYRQLANVAPLMMLTVQVVCGFVYGLMTSSDNRSGGGVGYAAFAVLFLGIYTLALGYGYVALTHTMLWLFRRAGWVN